CSWHSRSPRREHHDDPRRRRSWAATARTSARPSWPAGREEKSSSSPGRYLFLEPAIERLFRDGTVAPGDLFIIRHAHPDLSPFAGDDHRVAGLRERDPFFDRLSAIHDLQDLQGLFLFEVGQTLFDIIHDL